MRLVSKVYSNAVSMFVTDVMRWVIGLRRLLHVKNKELRHMKSLAATILAQRSETEQFFLEALEEVKEIIRRERKVANKSSTMNNNLLNTRNSSNKAPTSNTFLTASAKVSFPPILANSNLMNTTTQLEHVGDC